MKLAIVLGVWALVAMLIGVLAWWCGRTRPRVEDEWLGDEPAAVVSFNRAGDPGERLVPRP